MKLQREPLHYFWIACLVVMGWVGPMANTQAQTNNITVNLSGPNTNLRKCQEYTYQATVSGNCKQDFVIWGINGGTIVSTSMTGAVNYAVVRWNDPTTASISATGFNQVQQFLCPNPRQGTSTITPSFNTNDWASYSSLGSWCSTDGLSMATIGGNQPHNWYASTDLSNWELVASTSNASWGYSPETDLGSDYLDKPVYFRAEWLECESSVLGPYTYYRAPPTLTSANLVPKATSSNCSTDGQVVLQNLKYPDGTAYNGEPIIVSVRNSAGTLGFNATLAQTTPFTISNGSFFAPGTYEITLEYSVPERKNACYSRVTTFTIPAGPAMTFGSASASATPTCFGGTNGAISVSVNGGLGNYVYEVSDGNGANFTQYTTSSSRSITITNRPAGSKYRVRITDQCGSQVVSNDIAIASPAQISLTSITVPSRSTHNGSDISCIGATDGSLQLTASGGTGGLRYNTVNNFSTAQTSNTFGGLGAGSYNVYVWDAQGCYGGVLGQTLNPPSAVATPTLTKADRGLFDISCAGGTDGEITVASSGGTGSLEYSLNAGAWQSSSIFSGLGTDTYSVEVRDANHCTASSASESLSEPPALTVSGTVTSDYNGAEVRCVGESNGSIAFSASGGVGGYTYSLDGSHYFGLDTFYNLNADSYTVFVKDDNECVSTGAAAVVINDPPPIVLTDSVSDYNGVNITCADSLDGWISVDATGGTGALAYAWDGGQITDSIGGLAADTYGITITDDNGCTQVQSYTLTPPLALAATPTVTNVSCFAADDGSIQQDITGGTMPYSFAWNHGSTDQNPTGLAPGAYSDTITDVNGCLVILSDMVVTEPLPFNINIAQQVDVDCFDQPTGVLTMAHTGGTGPVEYSFDNVSYTTSNVLGGLVDSTYLIWGRDSNNCVDLTSATIAEPTLLVATITQENTSTCGDFNGSAQVVASGGNGGYVYGWKYVTGDTVVDRTSVV